MSLMDIIRHHWLRRRTTQPQVVPADLERIDRAGQIIHCDVSPARHPPRIATLGQLADATKVKDYVPAAFLAQKARSAFDGICGALDALPDEGHPGVLAEARLRRVYERRLRRVASLTNGGAQSRRARRDPSLESSFLVEEETSGSATDSFFDAVKYGSCDLRPAADDGFYAYSLYTLTALLRPDQTSEARRRSVGETYGRELDRFAASFLLHSREPQVKQVVVVPPGARAVHPRYFTPGLTVEPLPTFYALTGDAFRFLRTVVQDRWGPAALELAQWPDSGPAEATIGSGIDEVVELCERAAHLSWLEIRGAANADSVKPTRELLFRLWSDPDVTRDARGMIPLGRTGDATQVRTAVFVGWDVHRLTAELKSIDGDLPKGVAFGTEAHPIPLPIVREMTVPAEEMFDPDAAAARFDAALRDAPATLRWSR